MSLSPGRRKGTRVTLPAERTEILLHSRPVNFASYTGGEQRVDAFKGSGGGAMLATGRQFSLTDSLAEDKLLDALAGPFLPAHLRIVFDIYRVLFGRLQGIGRLPRILPPEGFLLLRLLYMSSRGRLRVC